MAHNVDWIPLFDGLGAEARQMVERLFEPFRCVAGTVIFEQGDPAIFLYLIRKGSVTIRYKPYDTPAINLTTIAAGGAFGWSAVVGNHAYTSGAIARDDLEAVRVRGTDLRDLTARHPDVGEQVLDRLAQLVSNRWKDANRQVRAILNQVVH